MFDRFFSRIYVLNLPTRLDRRRETGRELAKSGLSFDHDQVRLFSAIRPEDAGPFESIGARGCFLSHLAMLRDAEEDAAGPILILEDDVCFKALWAAVAARCLEELTASNWAMFYGGYQNWRPKGQGLVSVDPGASIQTTHCIAFHSRVIAPVRAYLETLLQRPAGDPKGGPMHVDGAYNWFRRVHPDLNVYAAAPPIAVQRSSRSDIFGGMWFDRMPVLRSTAALARRLRHR